jgi:hypothetical protein
MPCAGRERTLPECLASRMESQLALGIIAGNGLYPFAPGRDGLA